MRRLVITVLVLAILLLAADRGGAVVAGNVLAGQLRTSAGLTTDPDVTVAGFPFLTQVLRGRYDRVEVRATDLQRRGVTLSRLDVQLEGARVPLSDIVAGQVGDVPVQGVTATGTVSYVELATRSKIFGLKVTPKGNEVELTGRVTVLGQTLTAKALSGIRLKGNNLVVTARSISVLGQQSGIVDRALAGLLDFTVPVEALPYGLKLTSAAAGPTGVVLTASSGPTVLTSP